MNFYISNFRKIIVILFVFILLNIMLNLALYFYADRKTNKNSFIEEKISKAKHMSIQDNSKKLDYIFIGSSRTIYHISSNVFQDKGIEVYNYGVSNRSLTDYPYMVHQAIHLNPKNIVISIPVYVLFDSITIGKNELLIDDLIYIIKYHTLPEALSATITYIKRLHNIFNYSESINLRIKQFYNKFEPNIPENTNNINSVSPPVNIDCTIANYDRRSMSKAVVKCTNGDGILLGNITSQKELKEISNLKVININYVQHLNALLKEIQLHGITPIIILEPVYMNNYNYNILDIKAHIKAQIIDLTTMSLKDKYWIDTQHLNNDGRIFYSEKLTKVLLKEDE